MSITTDWQWNEETKYLTLYSSVTKLQIHAIKLPDFRTANQLMMAIDVRIGEVRQTTRKELAAEIEQVSERWKR